MQPQVFTVSCHVEDPENRGVVPKPGNITIMNNGHRVTLFAPGTTFIIDRDILAAIVNKGVEPQPINITVETSVNAPISIGK